MSTASLRLPDMLKAEATKYAADTGVSLNALVAFALREFLDRRPQRVELPPIQVPAIPVASRAAGQVGGGKVAKRKRR